MKEHMIDLLRAIHEAKRPLIKSQNYDRVAILRDIEKELMALHERILHFEKGA